MAETLSVTDMLPNKFEPKRKFRWILQIEGVDAFMMKNAARPGFETETVEIGFINATRYVAGKTKFTEMPVVLYDPIAPSGAQQIMEWIRLQYESVSARSGYADYYKRDLQLKVLDPVGTVVELWDLKGCWIVNADYGDLDYAVSDAIEISLTLRFDNAVLQY